MCNIVKKCLNVCPEFAQWFLSLIRDLEESVDFQGVNLENVTECLDIKFSSLLLHGLFCLWE